MREGVKMDDIHCELKSYKFKLLEKSVVQQLVPLFAATNNVLVNTSHLSKCTSINVGPINKAMEREGKRKKEEP